MIHSTLGLVTNSGRIPTFISALGVSQSTLGIRSLAVPMPSPRPDGDFYFFLGCTRSQIGSGTAPNIGIPAGWSTLASYTINDGPGQTAGVIACAYKVGSSEPASYTFTYGSSAPGDDGAFVANISRYSPVSLIDAPVPSAIGNNGGSASVPSFAITQPTGKSLILAMAAQYNISGFTDVDFAPSGYVSAGYGFVGGGATEIFLANSPHPGGPLPAAVARTPACTGWVTIRLTLFA